MKAGKLTWCAPAEGQRNRSTCAVEKGVKPPHTKSAFPYTLV